MYFYTIYFLKRAFNIKKKYKQKYRGYSYENKVHCKACIKVHIC